MGKVCSLLTGRGPLEAPPLVHSPNPAYQAPAYPPYPISPMYRGPGVPGPCGPGFTLEHSMPVVVRPPPSHWGPTPGVAGPAGLRAAGLPSAGPPAGPPAGPSAEPPMPPGPPVSRVMLKQADGFPEVRVYATPSTSTGHVGSIPSGTLVDLLGQQGNWRQVCYGYLRGWVGAKHVGHLPSPASPGRPGVRPEGAGHPVSSLGSRSREQPPVSPPAASTGFTALPSYSSADAGALPRINGSYAWIRHDNKDPDRERRLGAVRQTIAACDAGGYCLDGQEIRLTCIKEMCEGTQIRKGTLPPQWPVGPASTTWHHHPPGILLDVACERVRNNFPTVCINAASAYQSGGGFLTGGRHALEESICVRSTFFKSLSVASKLAEAEGCPASVHCQPPEKWPGRPWSCHIPETGCIVSPNVEVFRGGTNVGYPFLGEVVKVPIISVAMPNKSTRVRDAPVDAPKDPKVYRELVLKKFDTMLAAAYDVLGRPGVLVIPDLGCGAYNNDPEEVGRLLGMALQKYRGHFLQVHLVGPETFCQAASLGG